MAEIADMMLNGDLCQSCGVFLDGEGEGFPRSCDDCAADRPAEEPKGVSIDEVE